MAPMWVSCGPAAPPAPDTLLRAEPPVLDLGVVSVGGTGRTSIRLYNEGPTRRPLRRVEVEGPLAEDVALDVAPAELVPGRPAVLELLFRPATPGARVGELRVWTDDPAPFEIPLSGVGAEAQLGVTPSSLDFGRVLLGSVATATVRLDNRGLTALRLVAVTRDIDTSPEFDAPLSGQRQIAPGGSTEVLATYQPFDVGSDVGRLIFVDPVLELELPALAVRGEGRAQPLDLHPTALDFSGAVVGEVRRRPVRIDNVGTVPVDVLQPEFAFEGAAPPVSHSPADGWPRRLRPGDELFVEVVYAPEAPGTFRGALRVRSRDDQPPAEIPLSGGARAVFGPRLEVWPTRLDAGEVSTDHPEPRRLVIFNRGTAALELNAPAWVSPGPFELLRPEPRGLRIDPGSWHAIDVRVGPRVEGVFTATVTVSSSDDVQEPLQVPLTVRAVAGPVSNLTLWSPADFGAVGRGQSAALGLDAEATGARASRISSVRFVDDAGGRFFVRGTSGAPTTVAAGATHRLELGYLDVAGLPAEHVGRLEVEADGVVHAVSVRAATVPPPVGPAALEVALVWTGSAALDLHLVREGGAPFDAPSDASPCAPGPDWSDPTSSLDDPRWGAESQRQWVRIHAPAEPRYDVWVHARGGSGAARATVRAEDTAGGLGAQEARIEPGQLWWAGRIDLSSGRLEAGLPPAPSDLSRCF